MWLQPDPNIYSVDKPPSRVLGVLSTEVVKVWDERRRAANRPGVSHGNVLNAVRRIIRKDPTARTLFVDDLKKGVCNNDPFIPGPFHMLLDGLILLRDRSYPDCPIEEMVAAFAAKGVTTTPSLNKPPEARRPIPVPIPVTASKPKATLEERRKRYGRRPRKTPDTVPLIQIPFYGHDVIAAETEDGIQVFVKRISDRLGLDWEGQRQRIERNQLLAECAQLLQVPSAGGLQQETTLALKVVNFWLAGIGLNQVEPSLRETVLAYQRDCADTLYRYFMRGFALDEKRMSAEPEITRSAAAELRDIQFEHIRPQFMHAMTLAADYPHAAPETLNDAFAQVQNVAYAAATKRTAAGLVLDRCDHRDDNCGVTKPLEYPPTTRQLSAGINYLSEDERSLIASIWDIVLSFVEGRRAARKAFYLKDIVGKVEQAIFWFLEREAPKVTRNRTERERANEHARRERELYIRTLKEKRQPNLFPGNAVKH